MDKKEFEENYIFEKYKDTPLKNSKEFRKKIEKHINIDVSSVYAKIINYQIKTYGETLIEGTEGRSDNVRNAQNSFLRNKARRKT